MAIGNVDVIDLEKKWNILKMHAGIYDRELWACYYQMKYYEAVWNKLIKRSFIEKNNLTFQEGLIHEDYLWSFMAACHLKCIAVTDKITYQYFRRPGSLDTQTDGIKHNWNYCRVCYLQAKYACRIPSMWMKKSVFEYIEDLRVRLFQEALEMNNDEVLEWNYSMIRKSPNWNVISLLLRQCTKGSILRSFHKFFPYKKGMNYYKRIVAEYGF